MTPAASNPTLTDEGGPVFQLLGRDDQAAALAAGYLAERWAEGRIGIIHDGRVLRAVHRRVSQAVGQRARH